MNPDPLHVALEIAIWLIAAVNLYFMFYWRYHAHRLMCVVAAQRHQIEALQSTLAQLAAIGAKTREDQKRPAQNSKDLPHPPYNTDYL